MSITFGDDMATLQSLRRTANERIYQRGYPVGGRRFDAVMTLLCMGLIGGIYLDGWAHNHIGAELETFFTPWHAVMYAALGALFLFIMGTHLRYWLAGYRWGRTVPRGYHLSLIGAGMFALAGVGDMVWHTVFGVELGFDAALSPPHLIILISMVLIVSGGWRAAWHRDDAPTWANRLPAALSVALTLSALVIITQLIHPFAQPVASSAYAAAGRNTIPVGMWGIASFLVQAGLLMSVVLLCLRRWGQALPFGFFALIFTLPSALLATQTDEFRFVPVMLVGGLLADVLLRWLKPLGRDSDLTWLRVYAALIPVLVYGLYFVVLLLTGTTWWRVHAITGVVFAAGAVSIGLSYLLWTPTPTFAEHD